VSPPLPPGLLLDVQRRLESLYALEPQTPVTEFLISHESAERYPGGGSRTVVAQDGDEVGLGVFLDESVAAGLRGQDPRVQLCSGNLGPFCTLTEEVSHFLYLLFRAQADWPITPFELELQGEIDKYLTAAFFLSLQNEGAVSARLKELLFQEYRLAEHLTAEETERYRAASRLAYRYCAWLEAEFLRRSRLTDLAREARRFYRLGQREKLERIASRS
jgi:hypothetical protein